jgi:protein-S-isoprenylcysteine O-methyltransferase Ste14
MIMTAFKSLLFFIFVPGTMAGFIPLMFLRNGAQIDIGPFSYVAPFFWVTGLGMLIWCFWDFVQKGQGTPAPVEPPKELVVSGLYHYVRNPMYVGVLMVILGHFFWFGYWSLLLYAGIFLLIVHIFVTLYEEPHLKETFGETYENYLQRVPRWIPRFK